MIEIKNKNWNDVTISMWQELNLIDTDSEITKLISQISILTDTDSEEIRKLPMKEFRSFTQQIGFLSEKITTEVETRFTLDGKLYGLIPSLEFITTGEWIDAENWRDKPIENLHLYAAMLYRPVTKDDGVSYEIEPHRPGGFLERAQLFKDRLSITTIHGAVLFFSASAIVSMEHLTAYLTKMTQEASLTKTKPTQKATKKQKPRSSKKTGDSMI